METLTITASEFRSLVEPVLPLAGSDDTLPVLTAVQVQAEGKWLTASATDRFRAGIKRIEKRASDEDPTIEWPTFAALIPTRAIRSLLTMYKPRRGTMDPTLTLTVEGNRLTAEAVGLFAMFDAGRFVYTLQDGEYPKFRRLVREALDTPEDQRSAEIGLNPKFLSQFKSSATVMRYRLGSVGKPIIVTDDAGFIGILMPRKLIGSNADRGREDWSDTLGDAPEKPEPKKATRKKASAA
jgi:hypothetical protein